MRRTIFAAVAVAAAAGLVTTHVPHASADTNTPSAPSTPDVSDAARAATCAGDGVAMLCANALPSQDNTAINYQVTQMDGPGIYSIYYTNTNTGVSSQAQVVGPLGYQSTATGVLYAAIQQCYNVTLNSAPGTSLTVGPVCG